MHRTRGGHAASKPIDHMRSTQHHVRHSEAHIWIEFRVKQLTLMPATCREHRGYAQHKTGAKELGAIPCALTTREVTGCGTWPCYNTILESCPTGRVMWNTRPTTSDWWRTYLSEQCQVHLFQTSRQRSVPSRGPVACHADSPPPGLPLTFLFQTCRDRLVDSKEKMQDIQDANPAHSPRKTPDCNLPPSPCHM